MHSIIKSIIRIIKSNWRYYHNRYSTFMHTAVLAHTMKKYTMYNNDMFTQKHRMLDLKGFPSRNFRSSPHNNNTTTHAAASCITTWMSTCSRHMETKARQWSVPSIVRTIWSALRNQRYHRYQQRHHRRLAFLAPSAIMSPQPPPAIGMQFLR